MILDSKTDIRQQPPDIQDKFISYPFKHSVPEKYLDFISAITTICPKLVLTGQLSFHLLGFIEYNFTGREPDLDFALTESLTEQDIDFLKGFFDLEVLDRQGYIKSDASTVELMSSDLISLIYKKSTKDQIVVDIFTKQITNDIHNLLPLKMLSDHIIFVQHPKIAISYKALYAFSESYGKKDKHKNDLIDLTSKHYSSYNQRMGKIRQNLFDYTYYLEHGTFVEDELPF